MNAEAVDTNVMVRFLVGDVPARQRQAEAWFREAEEGVRTIVVIPLVVAETCFVLESHYKKQREEIAQSLEIFLSQRWLQVEGREVFMNVWGWYRKGLHFVDSYLLAWAHVHAGSVLTFDKPLGKKGVV